MSRKRKLNEFSGEDDSSGDEHLSESNEGGPMNEDDQAAFESYLNFAGNSDVEESDFKKIEDGVNNSDYETDEEEQEDDSEGAVETVLRETDIITGVRQL
uniref:Uncharacterized protein n=1 Tax=Panagrolaimus superbus TaxID=310955 RepID=A0A914ZCI0_9BILA